MKQIHLPIFVKVLIGVAALIGILMRIFVKEYSLWNTIITIVLIPVLIYGYRILWKRY